MNEDSIPLSALSLGIGFNGYEELARNVREVASLRIEERQKLLDTANASFSRETKEKIGRLVYDMADDRKFYKIAGMDYARGPPANEAVFTSGLIYYLLNRIKKDE